MIEFKLGEFGSVFILKNNKKISWFCALEFIKMFSLL